jgi:CDGSH-type Zn-finger protein
VNTLSQNNQIRVRPHGPLLCTGEIEVYDADGRLLDKGDDIALCRCGRSQNKPFCDGSHRSAGFEDDGVFEDPRSEPPQDDRPWKVTVRSNAMLLGDGPVTILCAQDCSTTRNKVALCRCGHSENKPFCDGHHKTCGFTD